PRADEHAGQRPLGGGGHPPGQRRGRGLSAGGMRRGAGEQQHDREPRDDDDRQSRAHRFVSAAASAALTRSGVSGTRRMRTPVASKKALATAAGTVRVDGSPAPEAGIGGWARSTMSTRYR